jgi:hypothetical protein
MLLIYPPVAKPSEPPAGIARLSGALEHHGVKHRVLDANLEGLLHLLRRLHRPDRPTDTWTIRAVRNCARNLASLKDQGIYRNVDRYKRAVLDLNRLLEMSVGDGHTTVGLANYQHDELSPLRSGDLIRAAEDPTGNPFYPYFSARLLSLLEETRPSAVGLSLNYLGQALCAFAMAGFLKRNFPGLKIILGGGLVTSWVKRPNWKNPFGGLVDHLVAGPGERQLLSMAGIQGVRETSFTPNYDFSGDGYFAPGLILPYSASMGCYWNRCSFCPEKAEDNPYIPVPVDRVMTDLAFLTKRTKPVLIHFLDNALNPSLLRGLTHTPPGLPWYGFTRISKDLTDMDFCVALKRSGCVMLKLGIESGDQEVLDRMGKGIDLGTASAALRTLKNAGISTYVYLLFGTPSETAASARKTLEFTVNHREEIGFLNLAMFNMPVHGPEAGEVETRSFYDGDLSLYTDFLHPHGWDRKEVRHFLANDFRKNKAVASILKKDPPIFTSNHAPFFVK